MIPDCISDMSSSTLFWLANSIAIFALCVILTSQLIPQILRIAFRKNLFDQPDERKIHRGSVPRLGGIAFKPVMFFSLAFMCGMCQLMDCNYMLEEFVSDSRSLTSGFCCVMILILVGLVDDLIGIRYKVKFVVQVLCGMMMIAGGLWINNLHGLFGINELSAWIGYPLTIFFTVLIINSINMIDGIDGLASGLCGATTLIFGIVFFLLHEYIFATLSFAMLGVLVPFFYFNVFGDVDKHKKIFMGDTGSLTAGMTICILCMRLLQCSPNTSTDIPNILVLAYSPLLVPCLDVARVYLHRVRNGKNPFLPDKNHIHHKLLALGIHQRMVLVIIVVFSILLSLLNILISRYIDVTLLVLIDVLGWTLMNVWLTKQIFKINKQKQE